jgi:SAM-dependent methyltransferase
VRKPLTELWLAAARARRRVGKPDREAHERERSAWLASASRGKSVADVGGLLNLHGGRAFAAEAAGATAVTLMDAGDPTPEFEAERRRRGSAVRFVQGDILDDVAIGAVGVHDVVWCTGVLYHAPDPVGLLSQLRKITRETLWLGTHAIPEIPGVEQGCVFYPYLSDASRAAHARAHWDASGYWGVGTPFLDEPMVGHANFWWGMTPSALRAMLRAAGFEVIDEPPNHHHPWYVDLIARPTSRDPLLPPIAYYRERGEARERGEELPFRDYYARRDRR